MKNQLYRMISTLSEKTELPLNEICKDFSVNMSGRREVTVDGVISVKRYELEEITLEVCSGTVSVYGMGLELKSFQKASLCIRGIIDKIEFGGNNERYS